MFVGVGVDTHRLNPHIRMLKKGLQIQTGNPNWEGGLATSLDQYFGGMRMKLVEQCL